MKSLVSINIRRVIQERGYRQCFIARTAGYTPKQFSDMLNDRKIIKADDIVAISKALGVPIAELFAPMVETA